MKLYKEPALSIGLPYLYKSTDKVNYNPAKYKSKVQPNALLPMIHTIEKSVYASIEIKFYYLNFASLTYTLQVDKKTS